jgi:hypothetical protein
MRTFATACVVLATILGTSTSHADGAFDFAQAERLRKDRRLEVVGIALTAVGTASYGVSLGLFFSDHAANGSPTHTSTTVDAWAIGTAVGAVAFLGAGIPLWAVGARRLRADRRTTPSAVR